MKRSEKSLRNFMEHYRSDQYTYYENPRRRKREGVESLF